jgi:hypothetical protein
MLKCTSTRIAAVFVACLGMAAVAAERVVSTGKTAQAAAEKAAKPGAGSAAAATAADAELRKASDSLIAAFNRGSAKEVAARFLPNAELTLSCYRPMPLLTSDAWRK